MWWWCYSRILAHYPYVVLGAMSVFAATCLVVILTVGETPFRDFKDPKVGFESRGTDISNKIRAYENLLDATLPDRVRTLAPEPRDHYGDEGDVAEDDGNHHGNYGYEDLGDDVYYDYQNNPYNLTDPFFCAAPMKDYARIVFESLDNVSLFELDKILAMCEMEDKYIRIHKEFDDICVRQTYSNNCCKSWSIGSYIALLSNKTSCSSINKTDVEDVFTMLQTCSSFYNDKSLGYCYEYGHDSMHCQSVPSECLEHDAVFHIFHHLADVDFMSGQAFVPTGHLTYTTIMLPIAAGINTQDLFRNMDLNKLNNGKERVVAVNFGIKEMLFDYYLQRDALWFVIAAVVVFTLLWIYTTSLFMTLMTLCSIFLTLEISYFLYTMVFEIKYFPFMNLLVVIIIIGIGVDDVFIYCKVWSLSKLEKNVGTLEKIISDTLRHASLSMFVTSFTTAAAFYASYVTYITALKCFAIFAGTTVIVNFTMMLTWIPAAIVIHEKWCSDCCLCYSPDFYSSKKGCCYYIWRVPYVMYLKSSELSRIFFEKILPWLVIKLRWLWLFIFGVLGAASVVIVLYNPKLKLPSANEFQIFAQNHPFEVYDFVIKDKFWFEKSGGGNSPAMPITIVWGVDSIDNGNKLDPYHEGTIVYDNTFKISTPEAQDFLLRFCKAIRKSSGMYQNDFTIQLSNCFMESFKLFMEQRSCELDGERFEPCCQSSTFPYSEEVFNTCLGVWMPEFTRSRSLYRNNPIAGPRYSKETGKLVAVIVEFNSKQPFSFNYGDMSDYYTKMNQFVNEQMLGAPSEMSQGWFISHLDFYDLQNSIASGTPIAIGISIAIATVVAFFTTLNLMITLYAMFSIAASIFATVASLVLLGWELNILESVTISVAIGLSIDFTLHYGMAYRLSPHLERDLRVSGATSRMASPVTLAAFTTFIVGLVIMPSTILAYRQLGTFLMLVMSISWAYSTLFFQSLLRTIGPQGGFGQFHWPSCDCCSGASHDHVDKTVYTMSESTLSSSHANSSETHELEPLTDHHHHHHHHKHHRYRISYTPSKNSTASSLNSLRQESRDYTSQESRDYLCSNSSSKSKLYNADSADLHSSHSDDEIKECVKQLLQVEPRSETRADVINGDNSCRHSNCDVTNRDHSSNHSNRDSSNIAIQYSDHIGSDQSSDLDLSQGHLDSQSHLQPSLSHELLNGSVHNSSFSNSDKFYPSDHVISNGCYHDNTLTNHNPADDIFKPEVNGTAEPVWVRRTNIV